MSTKKNTWRLGALAAVVAGAVAFGAAAPAFADPSAYRPLPGVGSDTTQDLNNGLAETVDVAGASVLGSYNATGSATITTRSGGVSFTRPDGSGAGIAALSAAISGGAQTFKGATLNYADVKFARSSSTPGSAQNNTGALQFIPLAEDAVTYATLNNTVIPSGIPVGTSATDGVGTSTAPAALTLRNIFKGGNTYIGGTLGGSGTSYKFYVGTGTPAAGFTKLNVYVPQSDSGTRKFWATTLGFSTLGAGVTDLFGGAKVQEHDGTVLATDATAIVPFSISQWIAQNNATALSANYGVTVVDRRHGATLNAVRDNAGTVIQPRTGTALNTAFPIARPVFTVVEQAAVDSANAKYNATLASVFVGATGKAYDTTVISDFGFAPLSATGTVIGGVTYKPGETPASLRANPTYLP